MKFVHTLLILASISGVFLVGCGDEKKDTDDPVDDAGMDAAMDAAMDSAVVDSGPTLECPDENARALGEMLWFGGQIETGCTQEIVDCLATATTLGESILCYRLEPTVDTCFAAAYSEPDFSDLTQAEYDACMDMSQCRECQNSQYIYCATAPMRDNGDPGVCRAEIVEWMCCGIDKGCVTQSDIDFDCLATKCPETHAAAIGENGCVDADATAAICEPEARATCAGGGDMGDAGVGDAGVDADVDGGTSYTFVDDIYPLFQTKCAGCHVGGSSGGLAMPDVDAAYTNLVGVAAAGASCSGMGNRVVASDSSTSILYSKLADATPVCGNRMPNGGPYLDAADIMMVKDWIDQGAVKSAP